MIVRIGENNALTYSFNATAKTITVTGLEHGNIHAIRNVSRSNADMKPYVTRTAVSGGVYTLYLSEVPASSADSDELQILLYIDGDIEDYDDTQVLFNKGWSSQKIQGGFLERVKVVTVATYADMLTEATGEQTLLIAVSTDQENMAGEKGAYIYIPSFGTGQLATNFI